MRKSIYTYYIWILFTYVLLFFLTACRGYGGETPDEPKSTETYRLQIEWSQAQQAQIRYPLFLYLFDEQGAFIRREKIENKNSMVSWKLPKGVYAYSLLSGFDEAIYSLPIEYGFHSFFSPQSNPTYPLLIGRGKVDLQQDISANIQLEYMVARISFCFTEVPDEVKNISISITPVYAGCAFDGNYWKTEKTYWTTLQADGKGIWTATSNYIFPSEKGKILITLKVEKSNGTESHTMNYTEPFKAGVPYKIYGSFHNGSLTIEQGEVTEWLPEKEIEFPLDDQPIDTPVDEPEKEQPTDDIEIVYDETLPVQGSFWKGFYVALAAKKEGETQALLLAPKQWFSTVKEAASLVSKYEKDGWKNWRLLSVAEAKVFVEDATLNWEGIITLFQTHHYDLLVSEKGSRYLCGNFDTTFSFANNTILKAGKTVKYWTRAVKEVIVKKP